MNLLHIEDSDTDRVIFKRFAEGRGHSVFSFTCASDSFDFARLNKAFDRAIVDFNLPDAGGYEVGAFLQSRKLRTCFLSGQTPTGDCPLPFFSKDGLEDDAHPLWKWITDAC